MDFETQRINDINSQQIKTWIKDEYLHTRKKLADKPLRLKILASIMFKIEIHSNILYVNRKEKLK